MSLNRRSLLSGLPPAAFLLAPLGSPSSALAQGNYVPTDGYELAPIVKNGKVRADSRHASVTKIKRGKEGACDATEHHRHAKLAIATMKYAIAASRHATSTTVQLPGCSSSVLILALASLPLPKYSLSRPSLPFFSHSLAPTPLPFPLSGPLSLPRHPPPPLTPPLPLFPSPPPSSSSPSSRHSAPSKRSKIPSAKLHRQTQRQQQTLFARPTRRCLPRPLCLPRSSSAC